jgi:hypothetical protein
LQSISTRYFNPGDNTTPILPGTVDFLAGQNNLMIEGGSGVAIRSFPGTSPRIVLSISPHTNETLSPDPHPQYLLRTDYTGGQSSGGVPTFMTSDFVVAAGTQVLFSEEIDGDNFEIQIDGILTEVQ